MNTHVYKASFITEAVLTILSISMDLAVGMLTEGTNLWWELALRHTGRDAGIQNRVFVLFCIPATPQDKDPNPWKQNQTGVDLVSPLNTFMKDIYYIFSFYLF